MISDPDDFAPQRCTSDIDEDAFPAAAVGFALWVMMTIVGGVLLLEAAWQAALYFGII